MPSSPALQNLRFAGEPRLERVARGAELLQSPARGDAVRQLQRALQDLGYFVEGGADGRFGRRTRRALRAFQRDHELSTDGVVGPTTLNALDRSAPPPGQAAERFPEYGRMLEDGVLDLALAIGFDEAGSHTPAIEEIEGGLLARGFTRVDPDQKSIEDLRSMGIHRAPPPSGEALYHRSFEVQGAPHQAVVRVITPSTHHPKARFTTALTESDAVFYGGHARYGTGPDFDHIDSPQENFVIGAGGRVHRRGQARPGVNRHMKRVLRGQANDLEARTFDPERYQLWSFHGCTTSHYLDELRAIDFGKDTRSLDIMGSTRPLYWATTGANGLSFVDGLMELWSEGELRAEMDRSADATGAFFSDGFADNGWRPPPDG